jgi:hypothetical protein
MTFTKRRSGQRVKDAVLPLLVRGTGDVLAARWMLKKPRTVTTYHLSADGKRKLERLRINRRQDTPPSYSGGNSNTRGLP